MPHRKSAQTLVPNGIRKYGKAAQLALTAVAMGVHAMSASAQVEQEPSLQADVQPSAKNRGSAWLAAGTSEASFTGVAYAGVAQGPERIEIRQSDQLIYTTVVPAGPYKLKDFALIDIRKAVHITVVDCDGERKTAVVDAASLIDPAPVAKNSYAFQDNVYAENVGVYSEPDTDNAVHAYPVADSNIAVTVIPKEVLAASSEGSGTKAAQHTQQIADGGAAGSVDSSAHQHLAANDATAGFQVFPHLPPILSANNGEASSESEKSALRLTLDEGIQAPSAVNTNAIENAQPIAAAEGNGWGAIQPNQLVSKSALELKYQPISPPARYALDLPVDRLKEYSIASGKFARKFLLTDRRQPTSEASAIAIAESRSSEEMPPVTLVEHNEPSQANAGNGSRSLGKARTTLEWSSDTRALLPYAYRFDGTEPSLLDVWGREVKKAKRLAALHHLNDGSLRNRAYVAVPVPAEASSVAQNNTIALIGVGGLVGGPFSGGLSSTMGIPHYGDSIVTANPVSLRYAQASFMAGHQGG